MSPMREMERAAAGDNIEGWQEVRNRRRRREEDHQLISRNAITYFFQNFPEDWDKKALWHTFQQYGTIVDLCIAKKRSKSNNRFGFVRFIRIRDPSAFARKLNEIWIGSFKIRANIARFQRNPHLFHTPIPLNHPHLNQNSQKRPLARKQPHQNSFQYPPPRTTYQESNPHMNRNFYQVNKSFAEIVSGRKAHPQSRDQQPPPTPSSPKIRMTSTFETLEFMQRALVGVTENFQALMNVKAFCEVEECPTIMMRYLGGLKMLVEFESKQEKEKFLVEGEQIWKPWFKEMYP